MAEAAVHVRWDRECSSRAAAPNHYSMQIGVGRRLIRTFTHDWIVGLSDLTLQVRKAAAPAQTGHAAKVHCLTIEAFTDPPTRVTCGVSGATGRPRTAGSGPWVSPGATPRGSRAPSARHRRTGTVLAGPVRCRCARIRSAYRSPLALTVRRWVG
ncbi:DUF4291 family protein [Micromonospora wenchangensis]|uniref:DUF4291 family protein n=1 Tax=Micromonospora wenchangensis TaxID=1185415 RepID=UPI003410B73B